MLKNIFNLVSNQKFLFFQKSQRLNSINSFAFPFGIACEKFILNDHDNKIDDKINELIFRPNSSLLTEKCFMLVLKSEESYIHDYNLN